MTVPGLRLLRHRFESSRSVLERQSSAFPAPATGRPRPFRIRFFPPARSSIRQASCLMRRYDDKQT